MDSTDKKCIKCSCSISYVIKELFLISKPFEVLRIYLESFKCEIKLFAFLTHYDVMIRNL